MSTRRYSLTVQGMDCAACAETVAKALSAVKGVVKVQVNFATERALVEVTERVDFRQLVEAVERAGYRLATGSADFQLNRPLSETDRQRLQTLPGVLSVSFSPDTPSSVSFRFLDGVVSRSELHRRLQDLGYEGRLLETDPSKPSQDEAQTAWLKAWVGLGLSVLVMALTMPSALSHQAQARWLAFALTTFVLIWVGMPFLRRAVSAARSGTATMDTLVSLGALSAYAYSLWMLPTNEHLHFDTATFLFSAISLSKGLEARAKALATASLHRLVRLLPSTATVLRDGAEQSVPLAEVQIGDLVLVRAGERVPVDGIAVAGKASVDESLLTGESEPVVKGEGDEVLGGSLCLDGFLQVEALRVGESTFTAQMARLMEEAQATKPSLQRLADWVAAVFVPLVLSFALVTFIGWMALSGDLKKAMVAAVSVMVIACPCAMVLATPTALAVALGRLAQMGIWVRNAEAIEKAAAITAVVLDKTGTVTEGQMRVVAIWSPQMSETELLQLAASVERTSRHPIAQAITKAALERNLPLLELAEAKTEVGIGVAAKVKGRGERDTEQRTREMGHGGWDAEVFVGKLETLPDLSTPSLRDFLAEHESGSLVGVWVNGELAGVFALTDELRADAQEAVQRLKAMGVKVILATGDKPQTAMQVAQALGCDDVLALATPQRKAQLLKKLQGQGEKVLMVGDGVNDAIALAQADIGVAIASGADLAAQAADALLVTARLSVLADFLQLAKRTKRIMVQNLFWAFAYNMAALPLAAAGKLNPMIAAAAMALSDLTVVTNALRLRKA